MGRLVVIRDGARCGAENMAADAGLLARHAPGASPVLRLYRWSPPAVSYGYHQDPDDFDREAIARRGWGFVRRPTGGRAILHAQELTYAVVGDAPSARFGDDLHAVYTAINGALTEFLRRLGLTPDVSAGESLAAARGAVCFQSAGRHEVTVGGRKLVGSAQRRHPDRFLQHGSILTGPAHADLLACLRGEDDGPDRRADLLAATTNLGELLGRDCEGPYADELEDLLAAVFQERFG
ncbi:MAG: octanoyltransferase [Candidatus Latescibacteria bacterium]|nr:octanoyltransferase [Candidatus Latescibacterota bacterium]